MSARRRSLILFLFGLQLLAFLVCWWFFNSERVVVLGPHEKVVLKSFGQKYDDLHWICSSSITLCTAMALEQKIELINGTEIPKIIHQTFPDKSLAADKDSSRHSFLKHNTDYLYLLWDDDDVDLFFKYYFPEIIALYPKLSRPILKADIFRYAVVHTFGGFYSDFDTICLKPLSYMFKHSSGTAFVVGIESDTFVEPCDQCNLLPLQLVQWSFAGAPKYPLLRMVIDHIIDQINSSHASYSLSNILQITGPHLWTRIISKEIEDMTNKSWNSYSGLQDNVVIDDILLLTISGFSADRTKPKMGAQGVDHPLSFIKHEFWGSWK